MQRKYVTKKLVSKMSSLTNGLFKQSIVEIMNAPNATDEDIAEFMGKVRSISFRSLVFNSKDEEVQDILEKKELIDQVYLDKLIQLSSNDLQDILFLHKHAKPVRATRTVEAIISELARRSLLDDSSQSDAIYLNGDVDVKRKDKPASKKAIIEGNKTNKA